MNIGQRIKKRREEMSLTLEEVGKYVGVSRATIQRYESGTITSIPSDRIESLSKILKVTPAYLMGWEENITEPEFDDDMVVLARNAKSLTQDQKKLIKRMIDEFNKNNEE